MPIIFATLFISFSFWFSSFAFIFIVFAHWCRFRQLHRHCFHSDDYCDADAFDSAISIFEPYAAFSISARHCWCRLRFAASWEGRHADCGFLLGLHIAAAFSRYAFCRRWPFLRLFQPRSRRFHCAFRRHFRFQLSADIFASFPDIVFERHFLRRHFASE